MRATCNRPWMSCSRLAALGAGVVLVASLTTVVAASPALADTILCNGTSYSTCISAGYTDHGYGAHSGAGIRQRR